MFQIQRETQTEAESHYVVVRGANQERLGNYIYMVKGIQLKAREREIQSSNGGDFVSLTTIHRSGPHSNGRVVDSLSCSSFENQTTLRLDREGLKVRFSLTIGHRIVTEHSSDRNDPLVNGV